MYYTDDKIRSLHRIFDQNERTDYLRLDLNENPDGLPEEFIHDVLASITPQLIAQYPETLHFTQVLADYLGTDTEHLCITNGSAEAIRYVMQAFTSPGGIVVGVAPSYFMFQVYCEMYGRKFVSVPYDEDLKMDVQRIIAALSDDTQLLIILNPNNPIGNVYNEDEFQQIVTAARKHEITILIDEAYHYFYPKTFIDTALSEEHVFVTRTFSKLFSMAGCRLGYVVGWPEGVRLVQKLCTPHNTNAIALHFAEAAITTPGLIDALVQDYEDGRAYLVGWLDEHNYAHRGEAGNFIFIKPKTDANCIVNSMKEKKGILIKVYKDMGVYGDCLRVTIGNRKCMEQFTTALEELENN